MSGNHKVKVKVCGITNTGDAEAALDLGADAIGINMYEKSQRCVAKESVKELLAVVPEGKRVLIDVEPSMEKLTQCRDAGFDYFQIHFDLSDSLATLAAWAGAVGKDRLWLVPRIPTDDPFPEMILEFADTIVLDTYSKDAYGGTGRTGNWQEFDALEDIYSNKNWILAGGLNPDNIKDAIQMSGARYVDVNSGVEASPGKKDPKKLKAFFGNLNGR